MTRRKWLSARLILAALIIPLAVYVAVSVVRGRMRPPAGARPQAPMSAPPGGASEMKEFTFQQTREGQVIYRLRARKVTGTDSGIILLEGIESLEILRPAGNVTVRAAHGRLLRPQETLSSLDLDGSVRADTASGDWFESPAAHFDASTSLVTAKGPVRFRSGGIEGEGSALAYATDQGRVSLSGPVSFEMSEGPLSGWTASASALARESDTSAAVLSGPVRFVRPIASSSVPEWIESSGAEIGPELPLRHAIFAGPVRGSLVSPGGPLAFAAQRMDVRRDAATGGPSLAELRGEASLTKRAAPDEEDALSGPEIDVHFNASFEPETTEARGGALLARKRAGGSEELRARDVSLSLAAGGLRTGTAHGGVRILQNGMHAGGEEAQLDGERVALRGGRCWVRDEEKLVVADRIDTASGEAAIQANGKVHVRFLPAAPSATPAAGEPPAQAAAPLPLFSSGRTVYVESPEAEFDRRSRLGRFRGGVRAWQDDASLQSASLDFAQDEGTAHAWGGVVSRGLRRPAGSAPAPVTVTASEMFAEQATGLVRYLGGAVCTDPQGTLRAREIHVRRQVGAAQTAPQAPAPGAQPVATPAAASSSAPGGIESIQAFGDVSFISGTRRGRADEAEHRPTEGIVILRGTTRPAVFEDPATGRRFEGPALTLDLRTDTIRVGAETGERARIRFTENPGSRKR